MKNEVDLQSGPDLKPIIRLLLWFTGCYVVAFVGYVGSSQGLWYWFQSLQRPAWCLPVWYYTPIWSVAYGMFGWASWQIWISPPDSRRTKSLVWCTIQLLLSAIWPWLLFAMHQPVASVIVAIILFVTATCTNILFWKQQSKAGGFMIPYVVWIAYLAILNFAVWRMNR